MEKPQRSYYQNVTNVTPEDTTNIYAKAMGTVMETGKKIAYDSANAKMTNTLQQGQLKLNELTNQFRIANSGEPDWQNPDFIAKRNELYQEMDSSVSSLVKNDFNIKWKELENNNNLSNQAWVVKQNQENAITNLQETTDLMSQSAFNEGLNGNMNILDLNKKWETSVNNLSSSLTPILGEAKTNQSLTNVKSNGMIKYIDGLMAGGRSAEAIKLLEREDVLNDINNPESAYKLKEAAVARLFNADKIKEKQATIDMVVRGDELFDRSQKENIPYSELAQEFSQGNYSVEQQKVLLKMNGFTKESIEKAQELTNVEKSNVKVSLYDSLADATKSNDTEKLNKLNNDVISAYSKKAINEEEFNFLRSSIVKPMAETAKEKINAFDDTSWFDDDFGLSQLNDFIGEKPKASLKLSDTEKNKINTINDINYNNKKNALYGYYLDNLNEEAKAKGVSLTDLSKGTKADRREVYDRAATKSIEQYKRDEFPALRKLQGMPSRILSGRNGLENIKPKGDVSNMPSTNITNDVMIKAGDYTDKEGKIGYYAEMADGSKREISEEEYRSLNAGE